MASSNGGVPPGFRFHPTDEELLHYYLKKKIMFQKFDMEVIREVDLNKMEPWELQERCRIGSAPQNEWYFFSHKDRKYPTGSRTNRATNAGFWKATGRDKCIRNSFKKIGMRKTLVFYRGRAPHGQKTDWIMHEYRLEEYLHDGASTTAAADHDHSSNSNEDGWVVCRVFKKKNLFKTNNNTGGTNTTSAGNNHINSVIMLDHHHPQSPFGGSSNGGGLSISSLTSAHDHQRQQLLTLNGAMTTTTTTRTSNIYDNDDDDDDDDHDDSQLQLATLVPGGRYHQHLLQPPPNNTASAASSYDHHQPQLAADDLALHYPPAPPFFHMASARSMAPPPAPHHHQYAAFQGTFLPPPTPVITMGAYEGYTAAAASNNSPASHNNTTNASPDPLIKQLMTSISCGRDDAPPAAENVDSRPPSYQHLPTSASANYCEASSCVDAATQSAAAVEGRIRDEQGLNEWPAAAAMQTVDPQVVVETNVNNDKQHDSSSSKGGELAGEGGAGAVSSRFDNHHDHNINTNASSSVIHNLSLRGHEMDFWGYQK